MNTKYLKYAVGEILLVVVGILIALGLNNWNAENKTRKKEKELLLEANDALTLDLENLKSINRLIDRSLKRFEELEVYMNNTPVESDSVLHYLRPLFWDVSFEPITAPYESLKAFGLNLITNDTIRNNIIRLYDSRSGYSTLNQSKERVSTLSREAVEGWIKENFKFVGRSSDYMSLDMVPKDPLFITNWNNIEPVIAAQSTFLWPLKARILGIIEEAEALQMRIKREIN